MQFLKTAVKQAQAPTLSITKLLIDRLGGYEKARGFETLHASAVTRSGFCPREVAMLDLAKAKPKDEYIPTALRVTFDMGRAAEELFREKWLCDRVYGNWQCRVCEKEHLNQFKPKVCNSCGGTSLRYEEYKFYSPELNTTGSMDTLVNLDSGSNTFVMTELKTVSADEFNALVAPLAEHRLRTRLYLKLIADSDHPIRKRIGLHEARVFYISRGHGKKIAEYNEILPFKEFVVERDDDSIKEYVEKAKAVARWRKAKIVPYGVCKTGVDPRIKTCGASTLCFSGKYPPCSIVKDESCE